uniref:Serine/threonine-protein phosphatase 2A regulatory subunit B'' subunit gamma n=1 Tax=Steinernema glaseri TaxID=37863 RepID=A0A1I8A7Z8_9BILA
MSLDEISVTDIKDREEKRQDVRKQFLKRKLDELPKNHQMRDFASIIYNHAQPFGAELELVIIYSNYKKVREMTAEPLKSWLTAELFACANNVKDGVALCDVGSLLNVIETRLTMVRYFLLLSIYDNNGEGYLSASEFYKFYDENVAKHFPELESVKEQYTEELVEAVVTSKVRFFLDRAKCDKVPIKDILASGIITEINALCDGSSRYDFNNWFCPQNIIYVVEEYVQYMSEDGVIRRDNFIAYQDGIKNRLFLGKMFDFLTCEMGGEMDVLVFSKFQLILRYKKNPVSLKYIFEGLDIHSDGRLNRDVLYEHFSELLYLANARNDSGEYIIFDHWVSEVFDMLGISTDTVEVSLQDWLRGPCVHYVVLKLIDSVAMVALEREEDRQQFLKFDTDINILKVTTSECLDGTESAVDEFIPESASDEAVPVRKDA